VTTSQPSALLPSLFQNIDEGQRLTVLHIGSALPETVEFFSRYRCKLHFIDLFAELAQLRTSEDDTTSLQQRFSELLHIPAGTRLDVCLFWDLFNFLEREATSALLDILRPHLHSGTLAHAFAVHNLKTPQSMKVYGIRELDQISLRPRPHALPGYTPCNQGQLERAIDCFKVGRSVLLAESRLEMVLSASL
jgi:hypothetical protein